MFFAFNRIKIQDDMIKITKLKKKAIAFLYNHIIVKKVLETFKYLFFAAISAIIFAFGFSCFITSYLDNFSIITGGVSGFSQLIINIATIFKVALSIEEKNEIISILYTLLNIPLILFAFFCIGPKFSIFTAVNVGLTSLFIALFSKEGGIAETIATAPLVTDSTGAATSYLLQSIFARVLFAGVTSGISSALAYIGDISCGGIDIITYYMGNKKSSQIGKYTVIFNGIIVVSNSIMSIIITGSFANGFYAGMYSLIYLIIASIVIDLINLRNKKVRIEIVTSVANMGDILISIFPHGATVYNGEGVYSKREKHIFIMTVSSNEYKKLVSIAKKIDPNAFITALSVVQVFGNFYSKPVE